MSAATRSAEQTLTVSQLTGLLKGVVEESFPSVWVAGEISNYSQPNSGHCYFTLKDDAAQIRAVMWRTAAARLKFDLADGLDLICHGRLDVYPPRGSYQLVVDEAQPKGMGALELALRKLREKLAAEGLFDPGRKRPLPKFPRRIGFVTSPTGAAVRDFLEVLRRRWHGVEVLIVPVRVQGDGAAQEIARGIATANRLRPALDVLVVGRGGGSLEDLWCFNDERVVRAIVASRVPVVSAVGHEIDVTLADLAADVRALTPSEAAERVVPAVDEINARLRSLTDRCLQAAQRQQRRFRERIESLRNRRPFVRPFARVQELARRTDELEVRVDRGAQRLLAERNSRFQRLAGKLQSLSPLSVLARGYSVTTDSKSGELLRSIRDATPGQRLTTRLADGEVESVVDQTRDEIQ
ncbi:MAG: exodeoxyribonuclease VII large subunit [Pirellulales bacterium]